MIRLDAIAIVGLPQMSKADIPKPYAARVNCVLHSGPLSERQELKVWVNGVLQTSVHEGDQQVFSWQLLRAADQIDIVLQNRGVPTKHWHASWNERNAIVHTGMLSVQVFFDGKAQPPTEEARASNLSTGVNGSQPLEASGTDLPVMAVEQRAEAVSQALEVTRLQDQKSVMEGDALTDAQEENQWEDELGGDEAVAADRWEDELEDDEEDDDGNQWEDEEDEENQGEVDEVMAEEDERDEDAAPLLANREVNVPGERTHRETQQPPAHVSLSTTWQVATIHANLLAQEQTLASLQELLALKPKTLIVDVRPGSPQRKKHRSQDQLSKQRLRSVFGAKYWDRGWAISCTSQMVPRGGRIRGVSWCYVVNKPESHPDGIPSLVQKLAEGYTLVVIDSLASYGESRRRAVVEELQQRVAALGLGPLG